jgi:hypothetical protein
VRITRLTGDELLHIREENGDLVTSVQSRTLTLRVPMRELEEASRSGSPRLAFGTLNAATQVWGDTAAIAELRRTPEYALLPELSYQLGKLGITGRAYPPSLLLHAIAMRAAEQLGIQPDQPEVVYRLVLPRELAVASSDLLKTLWPDPCDGPETPNVERPAVCPDACEAPTEARQNLPEWAWVRSMLALGLR